MRLIALALLAAGCGTPREVREPLAPEERSQPQPAPLAEIRTPEPPLAIPVAPAFRRPLADPAFRAATSRAGTYTVAWRPLGGAVPKNEYFELEAYLYEGERLLPGAELIVSAWMPEHGHGMIVQPRTLDAGDGRYQVSGMLFHMRGKWELFFDVVNQGLSERTQFDLEIR